MHASGVVVYNTRMGTLLFMGELKERANWYVKDAYYDSYSREAQWKFAWPNPAFPHQVAINEDDMLSNKPDIRKWIECNDVGTVVYSQVSKSYRVWWSSDAGKRDWDHTTEIRNNWEIFNFEDGESALAFTLRFNNLVKPMTDDHPTKHHGERYHR